jgi:serine/threonine protein phosphatase PrpC
MRGTVIGFDSFEYYALSDVGIRRPHNQDAHAVILAKNSDQWRDEGHLLVVADGMGGHAVGEKASQKAAGEIPLTFLKYAHDGVATALRRAFIETNTAIHSIGQKNKEFQGMGTTSSALVLRPEGAWIAHVGDSRIYRIRDEKIDQLTFDHSYVWEMARRQKIAPEEVQGIKSNVIVRSLGPDALVQVDVEGPHPLEAGDVFVLCSDGLSGPVSDSEIGAVASLMPPEEACQFLVQLANLRGGPDNITVMIIRIGRQNSSAAGNRSLRDALRKAHWSIPVLALGVALTLVALLVAALINRILGLMLFLLAGISSVVGLIGLTLHARADQKKRDAQRRPANLNTYRSFPCDIDRGVVEKLARANEDLRDKVKEAYPQLIPETFAELQAEGLDWLKKGNLQDAFREFCRAMHELAKAYNKMRTRSEMFQPVWEKKKKQA